MSLFDSVKNKEPARFNQLDAHLGSRSNFVLLGVVLFSIPAGFYFLSWTAFTLSILALVLNWRMSFELKLFFGIICLRFTFDLLHIQTWNPIILPTTIFLIGSFKSLELRNWLKSLKSVGRLSAQAILFAALTSFLSACALYGWKAYADPDLSEKLTFIPNVSLPALLLGGLGFSIANAWFEEFVFRGLFWNLLQQRYSIALTCIFQALLFGMLHYTGFPSGLIGCLMASVYALALGYLRILNQSLFLPFLAHITSDIVIFAILVHWAGKV